MAKRFSIHYGTQRRGVAAQLLAGGMLVAALLAGATLWAESERAQFSRDLENAKPRQVVASRPIESALTAEQLKALQSIESTISPSWLECLRALEKSRSPKVQLMSITWSGKGSLQATGAAESFEELLAWVHVVQGSPGVEVMLLSHETSALFPTHPLQFAVSLQPVLPVRKERS